MTAQIFPPRTLNARKLARLADEPAPIMAAALPGHCTCGHRLSVANTSGVCDSCIDERARLAKVKRLPGQCHCGRGPIVYRGLCRICNQTYTQKKRAEYRRMEW